MSGTEPIAQKSNWGQFGDGKFILGSLVAFRLQIRIEEAASKGGFVVYQFSCGAIFAGVAPQNRKNVNNTGGEIATPNLPRYSNTVHQSPFSIAF